jgi:inner membrane protein
MDNITHTLVGLMLARTGLEKTTVRGTAMMMLAANAPDIDGIFWFDRLRYMEYHRGYPHALPFVPLLALLPMALVRAKFSWRSYVAAMVGVLSHPLIDWTNPFGTRLLLPFTDHRYRLDINTLIDVWVWVLLWGAVAATALARLVSTEIGERKASGARRGWAWAALLAVLVYMGGRDILHQRAVNVLSSRLYEGAVARNIAALPTGSNPMVWRGVVEGDAFAIIVPVNLAGEFDPAAGRVFRQAPPGPAIEAARRTRPFQVFSQFSQMPFWRVTPIEDGVEVRLTDLRFGTPDNPGFAGVTALVGPNGTVREARFGF